MGQALRQYSAKITAVPPCKYKVEARTKYEWADQYVTAKVTINWSISPNGGSYEDSQVASGMNVALAELSQTKDLPGVGTLNFVWTGKHYVNGTLLANSGGNTTIPCDLVVDDPCKDCGTGGGPSGGGGDDCPLPEFCKWNGTGSLTNCPPDCASPILIDMGRDGFQLGGRESATFFDLLGNGLPFYLYWVAESGNDAFLVVDRNGNGLADDGSELFGNGTRLLLERNRLAPNGFVGLAQYDHPALGGNDDGMITLADAIWEQLMLWFDDNGDGMSQIDEMSYLSEAGLTRLETIPRKRAVRDDHGNRLALWASSYTDLETDSIAFEMVDVYFKRLWPR
jgi:hypothetical protein